MILCSIIGKEYRPFTDFNLLMSRTRKPIGLNETIKSLNNCTIILNFLKPYLCGVK